MNIKELKVIIKDLPDDMLVILNQNESDDLIVADAWKGAYDRCLNGIEKQCLYIGYGSELENKGINIIVIHKTNNSIIYIDHEAKTYFAMFNASKIGYYEIESFKETYPDYKKDPEVKTKFEKQESEEKGI